MIAEVAVGGGDGAAGARHVDHHGSPHGERCHGVVRDDVVVQAERTHELDVAGAGDAHEIGDVSPGSARLARRERVADRRLAARRHHDRLLDVGERLAFEERLDQESGEVQHANERVALLVAGVGVHRVAVARRERSVDGSVGGAVRAVVAEAVGRGRGRVVDRGGHREPSVHVGAQVDAVDVRLDDRAPSDCGDEPPVVVERVEAPVRQHVAELRVRDRVRGDRDVVDAHPHLPVGQLAEWLGPQLCGSRSTSG